MINIVPGDSCSAIVIWATVSQGLILSSPRTSYQAMGLSRAAIQFCLANKAYGDSNLERPWCGNPRT